MPNEHFEEWLIALESGEYEQGHGSLRTGDHFCCMGVACDLAEKAGIVRSEADYNGGPHRYYAAGEPGHLAAGPSTGYLPSVVADWLGLDASDGRDDVNLIMPVDGGGYRVGEVVTAAMANDGYVLRFPEIAAGLRLFQAKKTRRG